MVWKGSHTNKLFIEKPKPGRCILVFRTYKSICQSNPVLDNDRTKLPWHHTFHHCKQVVPSRAIIFAQPCLVQLKFNETKKLSVRAQLNSNPKQFKISYMMCMVKNRVIIISILVSDFVLILQISSYLLWNVKNSLYL